MSGHVDPTIEPAAGPGPSAGPDRRDRREAETETGGSWWFAILAAAIAAAPVLAAAVRAGTSWMPLQDTALLVMRSRDVFTWESPLLGMPTSLSVSFGHPVHHPGPMGFWPPAIASAIVDHHAAPMVGAVVVNVACVVGIVLIARRLGGSVAAGVAGLLVALSSWSLRDEMLIHPLNPYAGHLPLGLFLVAAVATARGRSWSIPIAVVAGSYAAQSHVSLLAPVGLVSVVVVVWGGCAAASTAGSWRAGLGAVPSMAREHRRPLVAATVLGAILWLPVIVDLLVGSHNLWHLARAGAGTEAGSVGAASAWDVVTRAIVSPGWLTDDRTVLQVIRPVGLGGHVVAVALVAASVAVAVALLRRGHRSAPAGIIVSLAALAGGATGLIRIPMNFWNIVSFYNYLWLWPVSAVFWGSFVLGSAQLVGSALGPERRVVVGRAMAGVAGALGLLVAASAVRSPSERVDFFDRFGPQAASIADQLAATLDDDQAYRLAYPEGVERAFVPMGVALELERRGFDIVMPSELASTVGDHRTSTDRPIAALLTFDQGLTLLPPPADGTEVARFTPSAEDQAELDDVEAELMALIEARGHLLVTPEPVTEHDIESAAALVASGELLGLWDYGLLADPVFPPELMARYERALSRPVRAVVVYAHPIE